MKNFIKLFIIFILINCITTSSKINTKKFTKYVIGCQNAGLFSSFSGVLNNLRWCKKNNKTPVVYWGKQSLYYQPDGYNNSFNVWQYYFEPVSSEDYNINDKIHNDFYAPDKSGYHNSLDAWQYHINIPINTSRSKSSLDKQITLTKFNSGLFKRWLKSIKQYNKIINEYIKIKKPITNKIDNFYNQNMKDKKTIGIHLRGTDKHRETAIVSPYTILNEANKYQGYQFFVATDEVKLLDLAKKILKGKVIYYDALRSVDNKPIHTNNKNYKARTGEDVLIEAQLLSKCNIIIHTCSNVSLICYYFNPLLKGILFINTHKKLINF